MCLTEMNDLPLVQIQVSIAAKWLHWLQGELFTGSLESH